MINLRPDCLVFNTEEGLNIPASAELVSVELLGDSMACIDPDLVKEAAVAVLHYFKSDLGQNTVTIGDFSLALEKTLNALGFSVTALHIDRPNPSIADADLRRLACESGKGFELFFFPKLRDQIHRTLDASPQVMRFHGLRGCVKQLIGAKRWTARCQNLNDQIVEFSRNCLTLEKKTTPCALVII